MCFCCRPQTHAVRSSSGSSSRASRTVGRRGFTDSSSENGHPQDKKEDLPTIEEEKQQNRQQQQEQERGQDHLTRREGAGLGERRGVHEASYLHLVFLRSHPGPMAAQFLEAFLPLFQPPEVGRISYICRAKTLRVL